MSTITTGKVVIYKPNFNVNPVDTLLDLPVLGAENTLYVIKDTGAIYLWNGSEFIIYDSIPTGGATGEVLAKASATDGDVEWVDPTGGVKEYVAFMWIGAPWTILKNTLGFTPVFTNPDLYRIRITGDFTWDKTIVTVNNYNTSTLTVYINNSVTHIDIYLNEEYTGLAGTIKIEMYP